MRLLEILLLLLNTLAFIGVVLPLPPTVPRLAQLAPLTLIIAQAHCVFEGLRWQMIPAYALAVSVFLLWWRQRAAPIGQFVRPTRTCRALSAIAIGLGTVGLAISVALPNLFPVFRFPAPSGPYAIGTLSVQWVDRARAEIFDADATRRRALMVQIWYPTNANPSAARAPYIADADAVMSAFARIHQVPEFVFAHIKYVKTNATAFAPVADAQQRFPVLLFLPGVTGFRQMNTFQIEALVSHGYIVVALDQPGSAAAVVYPDGHIIDGLTLAQLHPMIEESYLPSKYDWRKQATPLLHGRALADNSVVPYLAQDISFTLDRLSAINQSDPNGILTGRLDLQRVGAFGVSLGGIIVGDACSVEVRLRACMVMDAPMSINVVRTGLQQPSMWITRGHATMRLERQQSGGWSEADIEAHQHTMRAVYESLPGAGYFVQIDGMFHSNLTDLPSWLPLASKWGLSGPIDGQRAHEIINAYSLAFFDRHLRGHPAPLLDAPSRRYPEVAFESRLR